MNHTQKERDAYLNALIEQENAKKERQAFAKYDARFFSGAVILFGGVIIMLMLNRVQSALGSFPQGLCALELMLGILGAVLIMDGLDGYWRELNKKK